MKKFLTYATAGIALSIAIAAITLAASTTVVTPTNTQGWSTSDTRPGGAVNYVADATSPYPNGALQLTTDNTTTAKAQYLHAANIPLTDVTSLSYDTKQVSGPSFADPSYQLLVDLNGAGTGGFTTFVYEPYENGTVTPGTWQHWDVAAGQMWSSRSFAEGSCSVTAGGGGAPYYTLAGLKASCPQAVVIGFGVNIGSNNPSYNVYTDGVAINGNVYNFELYKTPESKDDCKKGGYKDLRDEDGHKFKNQGQCVSHSNHDDDSDHNDD